MKSFYRLSASAGSATLQIFDDIGLGGLHEADFQKQLDAVKGSTLGLEINSLGGDVFTAVTIINMLKASGKTLNVKVMGVAASAASMIAMAGHTIEMPSNTFMMIHQPSAGAVGNANKLRTVAAMLDKIGESITATYVSRTGMRAAKMKELLDNETWMTADEALAMRFATKVSPAIDAHATFSLARAALPARVAAIFQPHNAPRPRGVPLADEIKSLCDIAKQPKLAASFISAGKTLAEVRAALLSIHDAAQPGATTASLWNNHNKQGKK